MYVSVESPAQTHRRLLQVLARATLTVMEGTYAFVELPLAEFPRRAAPDALAFVRDDAVWSQLVLCSDADRELFTVFRFHFDPGLDNSGFVGWLASHLKARIGTGVFVVCGQNSGRGGIFDYWGCPAALGERVLGEVRAVVATHAPPDRAGSAVPSLDGMRMRVVAADTLAGISRDTLFEFSQDGRLVCARYAGGHVLLGWLVGWMTGDALTFRYAQVDSAGGLDGGASVCELGATEDGRVRLVERFAWDSRPGSGSNVLEEVRD